MTTESEQPGEPGREDYRPGLTWGLKRSFIRYVSRLPDGRHAETDGASVVRSSVFHFELADTAGYDRDTGLGLVTFRGDVRIAGHGNLLFVMIADPWVEFRDDGGVLIVVDVQHWPDRDRRMPLATLGAAHRDVTAAGDVWAWLPAFLTAEGRAVFNDQYPTGTELDPLVISLPA